MKKFNEVGKGGLYFYVNTRDSALLLWLRAFI